MDNRFLKKLMSAGMALAVSFSCFTLSGMDTFSVFGQQNEDVSDTGEHGLGYIEPDNVKMFDPDSVDASVFKMPKPVKYLSPYADIVGSSASDSKYDSKEYVTPVKDQGQEGVCWAFAATADFESAMLTHMGKTSAEYNEDNSGYLDLSENHLRYATSTDGGNKQSPVDRGYNDGGNTKYAVSYYNNGIAGLNGPIWESADPYDDEAGIRDVSVTKQKTQRAGYYLTKYSELGKITSGASKDKRDVFNAAVKKEIMDTGAVCFSFRSDGSGSKYFKDDVSGYGTTFYSPSASVSDHGVVAVGWDDNVPATAFATKPAGNGAWLCKNSWDTDWGDNGYFWMSYYTTISADSIDGVIPDEQLFDKIYEYDNNWKIGGFGYGGKTFVYNKYTTDGNSSETLNGFGTYLSNDSAYYKYYVSATGDPKDFEEVEVTILDDTSMSSKKAKGYYSADLWGWRVAQLVTPVSVAGDFLVGIETITDSSSEIAAGTTVKSSLTGVSYYAQSADHAKQGANVKDLGSSKGCVAVIKAYTSNKTPAKIINSREQTVSGTFDYLDPDTKTKSFQLEVTVAENTENASVSPAMFSISSTCTGYKAETGMKVSKVTGSTAVNSKLTLTVDVKKSVLSGQFYLVYRGELVGGSLSSSTAKKINYNCNVGFVDSKINTGAFSYSGDTPVITVPVKLGGIDITSIAENGLKNNKTIEDVTLADGILSIGSKAFSGCSDLLYVEIPDSVTEIAADAFEGCDKLVVICSSKVAKLLPSGIPHSTEREPVSDEYYIYGGDKVSVDYSTKHIKINDVRKGLIIGSEASEKNFKWVLEKPDGKAPSDVKLVYTNNKGKKVSGSSCAGFDAELTTKTVSKLNSYVILKGVTADYDAKKKTGSVYSETKFFINPLSVSGYADLTSAQTFAFNEQKGVGFEKNKEADNTYDLTMYQGRNFALPFKAKDGADKTLLYQLSGSGRGVTVVNGKVTAYNEVSGQQIKIFPLYKTVDCPVITVNVTVTAKPKSLKSNVSSVVLSSGDAQQISVGMMPVSNSTGNYTFKFNANKFSVTANNSNIEANKTYIIKGGMLIEVSVRSGATLGTKEKEYLEISCAGVSKALKIELKAASLMQNVKSLKESNRKIGKDGFVEINVPKGGAYDLGISVNPVSADNKLEWTIGSGAEGKTITGTADSSELTITGCIINAAMEGTYYAQAVTSGTAPNGEHLKTNIYKINIYDPSGSLFIQHPEMTDSIISSVQTDLMDLKYDNNYMIKSGMLMKLHNALGDCDKYFEVGDDINVQLHMSDNGCTEPIEWKSNKQAGLRVTTESADGNSGTLEIRALQPGTYTVTGTAKNTKQKTAFKVMVKKPDGMTDADLKSAESENGFERYTAGEWQSASALTVKAGEELPITLAKGVSGKLALKVRDGSFAAVNASSGIIKGKKAGTTVLTATVTYGKSGSNTFEIPLTVTAAVPTYKKVTVPVCAKKGANFKLAATGSNLSANDLMWYFCKWDGTKYGTAKKLADAGARTASISETGLYKVYPILSNGTGSGESMAQEIGIYDSLVTKANMNATESAKANLNELKKGAKGGTQLYLPVFANEGADAGDIMWSSSNSYLAEAEECAFSDVPDGEFKTANKDAYGWVKITVKAQFVGKVTLTGVLRNSGKKVSVSVNISQ